MPQWINGLMWIRNALSAFWALSDVGAMGAHAKAADAYRVGDRIGIFSAFSARRRTNCCWNRRPSPDGRVSIMKPVRNGAPCCVVSTAVHVHNLLGRLYMVPVSRVHPLIVKSMMRRGKV